MELAMQLISSDQTVRNDTTEDLKEFNSQSIDKSQKRRRAR